MLLWVLRDCIYIKIQRVPVPESTTRMYNIMSFKFINFFFRICNNRLQPRAAIFILLKQSRTPSRELNFVFAREKKSMSDITGIKTRYMYIMNKVNHGSWLNFPPFLFLSEIVYHAQSHLTGVRGTLMYCWDKFTHPPSKKVWIMK